MTIIASQIERFDRLSTTWWNRDGPMRPLHVTNALRLEFLSGLMARHFRCASAHALDGLRVLDVGCGGGLLAEPLAERGADVLGIDASPGNIASAQLHAHRSGVAVQYRMGEPAAALAAHERFDVVLALEVVEHVSNMREFISTAARHVAPGGLFIASTIDRTWKSWLFAIIGAEYVFRVLPRGTHHWARFVRPAELAAVLAEAGFAATELRGMRYLPVLHRASWTHDTSVNYLLVAEHGHQVPRSGIVGRLKAADGVNTPASLEAAR
jgi:2-polyprenyl-6-hydroxyphenyl methylase/3-demethylubiquinone-9 3-methyltransferase